MNARPHPRAEPLEAWLERQYRYSARAMLQSVSPVGIVMRRPGFGQVVQPVPGAVVASPVPGSYDPDPDYFFHWYRDSAIVIDALRLLWEDGTAGEEALRHFADFVRFTRDLQTLDGRSLAAAPQWRTHVAPGFTRYLRDDAELAAVHGDAVAGETRVNADGTLDFSKWARPQNDGPPLRALALLGWVRNARLAPETAADADALIRSDLEYTRRHWREPSFDLWEEEKSFSYFTLRLSAGALAGGATWLRERGERAAADACDADDAAIRARLDEFWVEDAGYYRSRLGPGAPVPDVAVILAAIHGGGSGAHSVHDPRVQGTFARLVRLFAASYPINHARARAPAFGRYQGDRYFDGGPWYLATLAAAEFCFRAATDGDDARRWAERGDGYLETVRAFTPPGGQLSEQFDARSGAQRSARHLAWSYAAFISCVAARRRVAAGSAVAS